MVSATSSSSRLLPPKERLREKTFQYCQRLIEQCDRSECVCVCSTGHVGGNDLELGTWGCIFVSVLVSAAPNLCSSPSQRLTKRRIRTCRKRWACRPFTGLTWLALRVKSDICFMNYLYMYTAQHKLSTAKLCTCTGGPVQIVLSPLSVSGGGRVHTGLCLHRGHLTGLPDFPVHQGALWSPELRLVIRQSPAAYSTVLPQPRCVHGRPHVHMHNSHIFTQGWVLIISIMKSVPEPVQVRWLPWIVRVFGSWYLAGSRPSCSTTPFWRMSCSASFDWTSRLYSSESHSTSSSSRTCWRWKPEKICA